MQGLYAIVDVGAVTARGLDVLRFADAVIAGGPVAIQLRDKRHAARETTRLLQALAPRCGAGSVRLVANDRPDLAALAGCGGLHLGQQDLPPSEARRVLSAMGQPDCQVGMSVHDHDELAVALDQRPDYLAFGPVFGTKSKVDPEPTIGLDGLAELVRAAHARFTGPMLAIGSIDADNVSSVLPHVKAVAVISALLPAAASESPYDEVTARARALTDQLPDASWT